MSPVVRLVALVASWALWAAPFILPKRRTPAGATGRIELRARWGISLEGIGVALVYVHGPRAWAADIPLWRGILGAVFAAAAISLAWAAVSHLGKQWRFDAGL